MRSGAIFGGPLLRGGMRRVWAGPFSIAGAERSPGAAITLASRHAGQSCSGEPGAMSTPQLEHCCGSVLDCFILVFAKALPFIFRRMRRRSYEPENRPLLPAPASE